MAAAGRQATSRPVHLEGKAMKAFWVSVAAAILIAIIAGVVLKYGVGLESREVNQSTLGSVRL